MRDAAKIAAWGVLALVFAMGANWGDDLVYRVHALILFLVAAALFLWSIRTAGAPAAAPATGYMDEVVRYGVVVPVRLGDDTLANWTQWLADLPVLEARP